MQQDEVKKDLLKFQLFLDRYKNDYEAFSKLYPNKTFEGDALNSNDSYLNILSDISLYSLHNLKKTHKFIEEKNSLKLSCGESKSLFAPMPPMSIVQFDSKINCFIPKKSGIQSVPQISQTNLLTSSKEKLVGYDDPLYKTDISSLKTCYDVHVFPVKIDSLKYQEEPLAKGKSNHKLFIGINSIQNTPFSLNQYKCNQFTFYINERLENAAIIYDLVMNKTQSIHLKLENNETKESRTFVLTKEHLKPLGFTQDELASQISEDCSNHLSLLKDYLYFQNKFMFFKIELPNEALSINFTSIQFTLELGEQKKLNFSLPHNCLEIFCTPVVYLEEDTVLFLPLRKGATEVIIAGKSHGLDAVSIKNGSLIGPYLENNDLHLEKIEASQTSQTALEKKFIGYPYFQNTSHDHSSLFIALTPESPAFKSHFYNLIVVVKSFYSDPKFFENTSFIYHGIKTRLSTILTPSKRRDLKEIAQNAADKSFYINSNPFDIKNKEIMENIVNIIDYSYNKKDYEENVLKKFINIISDIEFQYYHDSTENSFQNETKIAKKFYVHVDHEKIKGLSIFLISNILKALDFESSTINRNLNEVVIKL